MTRTGVQLESDGMSGAASWRCFSSPQESKMEHRRKPFCCSSQVAKYDADDYDEVIKELKAHFTPLKNLDYETFTFSQMS